MMVRFSRIRETNLKFPFQNQDAEHTWGFNKTMEELMQWLRHDTIFVANMNPFIIGDLLKYENRVWSILKPQSELNCPLCK